MNEPDSQHTVPPDPASPHPPLHSDPAPLPPGRTGGALGAPELSTTLDTAEHPAQITDHSHAALAPATPAANRPDPWAHRRGEPRVFAALWMLYLLAAVAGSIEWVTRSTAITPGSYSPAARIMLVVIAVGAVILWPMVRLCQVRPRGSIVTSVLVDVAIVLAPCWMVIWPLLWLAGWPFDVVAAIALLLAAWVYLLGGIVVNGLVNAPRDEALSSPTFDQQTRGDHRALWMALALAIACGGSVFWGLREARAMAGDAPPSGWLAMSSPFTAILRLTGAGLSGPQERVSPGQWAAIAITLGIGLIAWILASVRASTGRTPVGRLD